MLLDPLLVHGIYAVRRLSHFQDISALAEDKQLAHVQQALAQRSTSWSKDEAVCLTTLIGQSPETRQATLDAEHDQRMRVLFQSMKSVPAGIIFAKRQCHRAASVNEYSYFIDDLHARFFENATIIYRPVAARPMTGVAVLSTLGNAFYDRDPHAYAALRVPGEIQRYMGLVVCAVRRGSEGTICWGAELDVWAWRGGFDGKG